MTLDIFISESSLRAISWFPFGCGVKHLTLATQTNSLARYSKRTIQLLRAVSLYTHETSGSLNSLLRVLFNVPSRYIIRYRTQAVFKVGSWCLPNSDPISDESYSRYFHFDHQLVTGLSPCIVAYSKAIHYQWLRIQESLITPHLFMLSHKDSVCLMLFSLAVTYSISIDFFSSGY